MKKVILSVLFSSILFSHTLTVQVSNIEGNEGEIHIGLYNKADDFTFIDKVYKKGEIIDISQKTMTYTFTDIPSGLYAISLFHDKNSNHKLDKNFLGIPNEGYGFSNNLRPMFRPATFEESKFELSEDQNINISLGY